MNTETVYYIVKEAPCPTCEGFGMMQHPDWVLFWKQNDPTIQTIADLDKCIQKWFTELGYEFIPDEEMTCPDCNGTKTQRTEVELSEALRPFDMRLFRVEKMLLEVP